MALNSIGQNAQISKNPLFFRRGGLFQMTNIKNIKFPLNQGGGRAVPRVGLFRLNFTTILLVKS